VPPPNLNPPLVGGAGRKSETRGRGDKRSTLIDRAVYYEPLGERGDLLFRRMNNAADRRMVGQVGWAAASAADGRTRGRVCRWRKRVSMPAARRGLPMSQNTILNDTLTTRSIGESIHLIEIVRRTKWCTYDVVYGE